MSSIRKPARWLLLLVAMSMIAVACSGGGGEETPSASGTEGSESADAGDSGDMVSTFIVEPEYLIPTQSTESEGNAVLEALCTTLVQFDPETTEPYNAHAESIETEDNQTYTITLKEGWTFHNGEPITAQSYVDSWNYAAYGPNAQQSSNFFSNIQGFEEVAPADPDGEEGPKEAPEPTAETLSGLEVIDDTTFEVTLTEPFLQFPLTVGYEAFCPMPPEFFDDPEAFNEKPILNGPFMMDEEWAHDQYIKVVRFEDYQGEDAAQIPGLEFRIYADQQTAYNDFLAGGVDILDELPPEQIGTAPDEFGDHFGESPDTSFGYIGFPLYLEEWRNKDLRRAFSLAIPRQDIADVIFAGGRLPAGSFIAPGVPGYRENACPDATYDPDRAKELFDKAGGYDGPLTLWFNAGGGHEEWMEAVSNSYRDLFGIQDIKFESLEFSEYLPLADEKGFTGPFRLGWGMDYPSAQNFLEPLWASASTPPGGSNAAFFRNEEFDQLVAEGNRQDTEEQALEFYQQAEDILCEEMPAAPVYFGENQFVWSDRVENVYVDAFGNLGYSDITLAE